MGVTYIPGSGFVSTPNGPPKKQNPFAGYGGGSSSGGGGGSKGGGSKGGGKGGGTSTPTKETSVEIRGNEIFIDGQGYSVEPGKQAEFLASKGLSGGNYQQALEKAKQIDTEYKRQQEIKKAFDVKQQQQLQQQQAFAKYQQSIKNIPRQQGIIKESKAQKLNQLSTKYLGFNPAQAFGRAKETVVTIYDQLSGKSYSLSQVAKQQSTLNKDVEKFNTKYGNRELSDAEFQTAQAEANILSQRQERLNQLNDQIASSTSAKIYSFLEPTDKRLTTKQKETYVPKDIRGGSLPLVPASSIPAAITGIRFLGVEKGLEGGKTAVNIAYITSRGRVGEAVAVIKQDGEIAKAAITGRSAGQALVFPTGKIKPINVESYSAVEKSLGKAGNIQWDKLKGNALEVQQVLQGQKQVSLGRVIIKGGKNIPTPTTKNIKVSDFISVSKSIQKEQLSLIKGGTITSQGARATFTGVVSKQRGPVGFDIVSGKGTGTTTLQKQTLQNLLGNIAASEAKATFSTITKAGLTSAAGVSVKQIQTTTPVQTTTQRTSLNQRQVTSLKDIQRQDTKVIQGSVSGTKNKIRTTQRQQLQQGTEQQQQVKQTQSTEQVQRSLQKLGLRQQQQLKQQSLLKSTRTVFTPINAPVKGIIFGRRQKPYKQPKQTGSFRVFMRRFGKFKQIGSTSDLNRAFNIGTTATGKTLGASFLVRGVNTRFRIPRGYYTKKSKLGTVFIEKRSQRLNTSSELGEIFGSKRKKRKKLSLF